MISRRTERGDRTMVAEILLLSVLAAGASGLVYLKRYNEKEKAAITEERQRISSKFRAALAHELRAGKSSEFSFAEFTDRCGVDPKEAELAAHDLYGRLCEKVV